MLASAFGYESVVKTLLNNGAEINYQNKGGQTALMWASKRGRVMSVKVLLDSGADINFKNSKGDTALSVAKTEAIAQLLLAAGAK